MKQTAVEWLVEQLENHNGVTKEAFKNVIKESKEMELQQIEFFFKQGHLHSGCPYGLEEVYLKTFKDESNT